MSRKSILRTVLLASVGFAISPVLHSQPAKAQVSTADETELTQKSLDEEMMTHQSEMKTLTARLDKSFQSISDARDAKGYVQNKVVLQAHEADIKTFRDAVREHKLFLGEYEHQCGVTSKQEDAMVQHQQQMKGMLYDVVESFDTFEQANDEPANPDSYITLEVGPA